MFGEDLRESGQKSRKICQSLKLYNQADAGCVEFDIFREGDLPFLFDKCLDLSKNVIMHDEVAFDEDVLTDEETCRCAKLVLDRDLISAIERKVDEQNQRKIWMEDIGIN